MLYNFVILSHVVLIKQGEKELFSSKELQESS